MSFKDFYAFIRENWGRWLCSILSVVYRLKIFVKPKSLLFAAVFGLGLLVELNEES